MPDVARMELDFFFSHEGLEMTRRHFALLTIYVSDIGRSKLRIKIGATARPMPARIFPSRWILGRSRSRMMSRGHTSEKTT